MTCYCTNCGSPLNDTEAFCTNCGTKAKEESPAYPSSPAATVSATTYAPPSQPDEKTKGGATKIVIGIVLVLAAAAAIVFFALGGTDTEQTPVEGPSLEQEETSSSSATTQEQEASSISTGPQGHYPPKFTTVTVSSQLPPDADASDYGAVNLTDGNSETAWNEGSEGDGTGESVKLVASEPQQVSSVSIMGGFPKLYKDGSDVYYKNNRPCKVTVAFEGGSESFTMDDLRGQFQTFTFKEPIVTSWLIITIDSVYKGEKFNDCCIAEIRVQ